MRGKDRAVRHLFVRYGAKEGNELCFVHAEFLSWDFCTSAGNFPLYGWFNRDVPHENGAFLMHCSSFNVVWLEDLGCCDPTVQEDALHHILEGVVVQVQVTVLANKVVWEPPFHP